MSLRVYNTLTRQKELFEPVEPGKVRMYLCGPTVYKSPHVGHMVGPVIFDAIKRYLQFKGYQVTWVTNITDVDDKLINRANELGTTVAALAEKHTHEYFECLDAFKIKSIDLFPKASDHIKEIIAMCQSLIDKGYAYPAGGNVWFDVTRDADYGKLSHRSLEEQEGGTRDLEGSGKRNRADFALWKAAKPGEVSWESPWGAGRPGWHIECSAMSAKHLGESLDIHGGGMDLMFPHHENELAQSESASGKPFVKYWMHNGLTRTRTKAAGGEWKTDDIHESSGNATQVRAKDLLTTYGPALLRYVLLSTHYRRPIEFTEDVLAASRKGMAVFQRLFERIERLTGQSPSVEGPDMDAAAPKLLQAELAEFAKATLALKVKFLEMMDDDFNTAGAIAVLHEMAGEINGFIEKNDLERTKKPESSQAAAAATRTLRNLASILGLMMETAAPASSDDLPDKLMALIIELRNEARQSKNFALSDGIRKRLTSIGITLEDRADGTLWRRG